MDHKMIIHLKCCRCNWNTSTVHHLDCRVQYSIFYIPAGVYWTPWFPYSSPNLHALCLLCDSLPTELTYTAKPYSTTPLPLSKTTWFLTQLHWHDSPNYFLDKIPLLPPLPSPPWLEANQFMPEYYQVSQGLCYRLGFLPLGMLFYPSQGTVYPY